jgi:low temperature requirement protein LtrA
MLQTTLLSLGVWWLWVYTSWVTNWLNPAGSYSAVRLDAWRACAFNFDPEGF